MKRKLNHDRNNDFPLRRPPQDTMADSQDETMNVLDQLHTNDGLVSDLEENEYDRDGNTEPEAIEDEFDDSADGDPSEEGYVRKAEVQLDPEMDSLSQYLRQIGNVNLLTPEEESSLARRVQEHNDPEALKRLIESNLRFVVLIAKKYRGCGVPLQDLISEGNTGLIQAAHRFDPNRGVKFISYAVWWIRQAIGQAMAEQGGLYRLPLKHSGMLYKLSEAYRKYRQENGEDPTPGEIAEILNIPEADVVSFMKFRQGPISLDAPTSDEEENSKLLNILQDENQVQADTVLEKEYFKNEMAHILSKLSDRERDILSLHFGLGDNHKVTLEEIGQKYGLTRERIRQIEKAALDKLKKFAMKRRLQDFLN